MRNASNAVEKVKYTFHVAYFFLNRVVYEITWKNIVKPQMTIWRMRTACWKPKAKNTHSEYVILFLLHGNNYYTNALQCYDTRTRWFKYDRDCLCVNLATSVPVIFEPPCTLPVLLFLETLIMLYT